MLLSEMNIGGFERLGEEEKLLLSEKDMARKAVFKKMNRHGRKRGGLSRLRRSGHVLRGNSFAGNHFGQRVVIKLNPVKNKTKGMGVGAGSGGANLYHHVRYISRGGAGEEGEKAVLFDREVEGLSGTEFFELCKNDRHHFRMIISPENGHDIDDFKGYVRSVMAVVEKDLGTKIEWVAAVHYDTDDTHAHVIMRGVNDRGADLVIGRDYIASGIRGRAQEIATELLGERSLDEIERALEKEVDAMRVTSLDRFIENKVDEDRVIDVRKRNNFSKNAHYEGLIKGRLRYLETAGLAAEYPPGVFTMKEDYHDVLYKISTRNDVINRLHDRVDRGIDDLNMYSIKASEGQVIEGRVIEKGSVDEISDRKYLLVEDMEQGVHYIPVGENYKYDMVEKGSLIRVRPGEKSSGKADFNINLIARANAGIYDPERHMAYIVKEQAYIKEENRQDYLDAHLKRLETLEKNGVVEAMDRGNYGIPDDVIAKGEGITKEINIREQKRFYPFVDVLSVQPLEKITQAQKKTWLDKELYKFSIGKAGLSSYDESTRKALDQRRSWLVSKDLGVIQSNGEFALRKGVMNSLDKMELYRAGEILAKNKGVALNHSLVKENEAYAFVGFVVLETGHWAVVTQGKDIQMSRLDEEPNFKVGEKVGFKALGNSQFEMMAWERVQEQQRQGAAQAKAPDKDTDLEL